MNSKKLSKTFEVALSLFALLVLVSCSSAPSAGPEVRIYYSNPDKAGMVREQTHEVLPYHDTAGMLCMQADEFGSILKHCARKNPVPASEYPAPK